MANIVNSTFLANPQPLPLHKTRIKVIDDDFTFVFIYFVCSVLEKSYLKHEKTSEISSLHVQVL